MIKNKSETGANNICGTRIYTYRKNQLKISQKKLADRLEIAGLDLDKNAIQRIESGERFVTDIELRILAKVLDVSYEELLDDPDIFRQTRDFPLFISRRLIHPAGRNPDKRADIPAGPPEGPAGLFLQFLRDCCCFPGSWAAAPAAPPG